MKAFINLEGQIAYDSHYMFLPLPFSKDNNDDDDEFLQGRLTATRY